MDKVKRLDADVVIAGSGPAGATVARELSKKGKKVIVLEKGPWLRRVGSIMLFAKSVEKRGNIRTIEDDGSIIFQAKCVGGGSLAYMGIVGEPHHDTWKKYGVDITQEVKEAREDCRVSNIPDWLIAPGAKRLLTAAQELGYPWKTMERFFDPAKCKAGCMKCLYGCPEGSKWTAVEFIREAEENGARILSNVTVRDVIVADGIAGGMRARGNDGQQYEINAKIAVASAGGMGTAHILQRSGIYEAGRSFVGDPTVSVRGFVKEGIGQIGELGVSVGWHDKENGVLFANALPSRSIYTLLTLIGPNKRQGMRNLFRYKRAMQIMCKVADESEGRVFFEEGKVSKTYTKRDLDRLDYGRSVAEKILIKAGCDPYSIVYTQSVLGHPGGTARIGTLVDSNLETSIKNLYCCDTSIMPEGPGIPPVLTLVSIAKRLAKHLDTVLSGEKQQEMVHI
ncbi:MAG: GMC family oxidoreductase N-terminal domain-containing protein [Dehalococcoidia bacterium]